MGMTDMKLSKEDRKDGLFPCSCDDSGPEYPYGLRISLRNPELNKLGIKDLPKVGTVMTITATAEVVSTSQEDRAKGEDTRDVGLQITSLSIASEAEKAKT